MTLRADRFLTSHADTRLGRVPAIEGNVPGLTLNAVPALSFRIVAGKETGGRQLTISNARMAPNVRVGLDSFPAPPAVGATLFDGCRQADRPVAGQRAGRIVLNRTRYGTSRKSSARPVESLSVASGFSLVSTERRNVVCDRHLSGLNPLQVSTNSRRHGDGFVYPRSFVMPDFFCPPTALQSSVGDLSEASESQINNSVVVNQSHTRRLQWSFARTAVFCRNT